MKTLPSHLRVFEGDLYDDRKPFTAGPARLRYEWHSNAIDSLSQVKATLRAGPVTWPGCYPLYFITHDSAVLCFSCARKQFRHIAWDFLNDCSTGWRIVGCEINYEDNDCYCAHCNEQIESAYGGTEEA